MVLGRFLAKSGQNGIERSENGGLCRVYGVLDQRPLLVTTTHFDAGSLGRSLASYFVVWPDVSAGLVDAADAGGQQDKDWEVMVSRDAVFAAAATILGLVAFGTLLNAVCPQDSVVLREAYRHCDTRRRGSEHPNDVGIHACCMLHRVGHVGVHAKQGCRVGGFVVGRMCAYL